MELELRYAAYDWISELPPPDDALLHCPSCEELRTLDGMATALCTLHARLVVELV